MSILFSNFAVEIRTTSSPPETRLIGYNMLHVEFHIFEQHECYTFAYKLKMHLLENGQRDFQISTYQKQVTLDIGNLYSYSISFPLITSIEKMRAKLQISGYLSSLEFHS